MKRHFKYLIILFVLLFSTVSVYAQNYTLNNALNGQTISTCSGTFYDNGGAGGNYGSNQDRTVTFCSSIPGEAISLNFSS